MVLVQKWPFFQLIFLGNIGHENVFYDILEREDAFLGYKNNKFKKSKKLHFSKAMVLVQKWPFFQLLHLGNIGQEIIFYDILERKDAFLGYKNKQTTNSKNWHGAKMAIFPTFFQINLVQDKVFYDILERKNVLLDCIKKKFKKWG